MRLNEFNTAIMAEGVKMIAEGCKTITTVLEGMENKSEDELMHILNRLQIIAQSNSAIAKILSYIKEDHVDGEPADEKLYFWQDLSGRGINNQFTTNELLSAFNPYEGYDVEKSDDDNDDEDIDGDYLSDDGETVARWLSGSPSIGETWKNEANRITRIK